VLLYQNGGVSYVSSDQIEKNKKLINSYKVYVNSITKCTTTEGLIEQAFGGFISQALTRSAI
jgi:hypothetical protein